MPKVSFIVPCYNTARFLPKYFDSVFSQSFTDYEIICINDGSTDNTLEVLQEYEKKDKRIRIIDKKHEGTSFALNAGLEKATGKYIWFNDSDDFIAEGSLQKLYDIAEETDCDFVTFANDYTTENYTSCEGPFHLVKDYSNVTNSHELFTMLINNNEFGYSVCRQFIKRKTLSSNNIYFSNRIFYTEDRIFILQLFLLSKKTIVLNDKLYCYVQSSSSICHSTNNSLWKAYCCSITIEECLKLLSQYDDNGELGLSLKKYIKKQYNSCFSYYKDYMENTLNIENIDDYVKNDLEKENFIKMIEIPYLCVSDKNLKIEKLENTITKKEKSIDKQQKTIDKQQKTIDKQKATIDKQKLSVEKLNTKLDKAKVSLANIKKSKAYKLSLVFAFIPRKLKKVKYSKNKIINSKEF